MSIDDLLCLDQGAFLRYEDTVKTGFASFQAVEANHIKINKPPKVCIDLYLNSETINNLSVRSENLFPISIIAKDLLTFLSENENVQVPSYSLDELRENFAYQRMRLHLFQEKWKLTPGVSPLNSKEIIDYLTTCKEIKEPDCFFYTLI